MNAAVPAHPDPLCHHLARNDQAWELAAQDALIDPVKIYRRLNPLQTASRLTDFEGKGGARRNLASRWLVLNRLQALHQPEGSPGHEEGIALQAA